MVANEQFMDYDVLPDPSHGMASCLDTMMTMILELSQKVNGQDEAVHEQCINLTCNYLMYPIYLMYLPHVVTMYITGFSSNTCASLMFSIYVCSCMCLLFLCCVIIFYTMLLFPM